VNEKKSEPAAQAKWYTGIAAMCLSLVGSTLLLAGCSGPSPLGLTGYAYVGTVQAGMRLSGFLYIGLSLAVAGGILSLLDRKTLAGKVGVIVPSAALLWLTIHGGRIG